MHIAQIRYGLLFFLSSHIDFENFPEKFISEKIGDQDFKEFFNGFMAVLPEFLDSFENKDYVLLGDLAEYEILPRLKALSAFASKMGGKA